MPYNGNYTNNGKVCPSCNEYKDWTEYNIASNRRDGHQTYCKDCTRTKANSGYNTEERWEQYIRIKYCLSAKEYYAILERQNGHCATCPKTEEECSKKRFHVDHDHSCCPGERSCGKCVRGLLCQQCNMAIGLVYENPDTLLAMIDYLGYGE
jgi:Recombination endonuclease VII